MNLRDQATLELKMQAADFQNKLGDLGKQAKELSATIKEIEKNGGKGGDEWKKYKAELKGVNDEIKDTNRQLKALDPSKLTIQQLENLAKQLAKEMKNAERGTDEYIKTAKQLGQVEQQLSKSKDEARKLVDASKDLEKPTMWQKISNGVNTVGGAFKAMMALQIISFIFDIGKAIFDATSKMEKYEKVLTTALGGNNQAAKESLAAVKQMAKDTIFTVDQLTEGYVKMVNRGMKPTQSEMTALADLAASQGKTFDQLVEAALDAQTGENERLKEFGIKAKKSGDEVTFSFKGMQQTVKNTPEAIQAALTSFGQMEGVAGQNAKMMDTLNGKQSNLQDRFFEMAATLGESLKPAFIGIFDVINFLLPVLELAGKLFGTLILTGKGLVGGLVDVVTNAFGSLKSLFTAGKELLSGNTDAAGKALDDAKKYGAAALDSIKKNATQSKNEIMSIWDNPNAKVKAEFAGKEQGDAHGKSVTESQKKALEEQRKNAEKHRQDELKKQQEHLKEVEKANQDAITKLRALEDEEYIESIRKIDGELAAERVKLQQKLEAELDNIDRSLAAEENKERLRKATYSKFLSDLAKIDEKDKADKAKREEEAERKRLDLANKRLTAEKNVLDQERKAEETLYTWKQAQAMMNSRKLTEVRKEYLDNQLRLMRESLRIEREIEENKLRQNINDVTELEQAILTIRNQYRAREIAEEKKTAEAKKKIDQDASKERTEKLKDYSGAFQSFLKGDFAAFSKHTAGILGKVEEQKEKMIATMEAIGQAAIAAANFLAEIATMRADREIREIQRAFEAGRKIREQELAEITEAANNASAIRDQVSKETTDKVLATHEQETNRVLELERIKSEFLNNSKDFDHKKEIERAEGEANKRIQEAERARDNAILNANIERLERTIAAEATRDAEIAAINARKDIDEATKAQLIASSIAKADREIQLANDQATAKIAASNLTAETAIADATLEMEEKIKMIELLVQGDTDKAQALIENAKTEGDEKVKAAEKEKEEKLRIVEAEKAARVQEKIELERLMHEEEKIAKTRQYELQLKAWRAQQKADIATALINGALATVKALASGMFPLNLVFAGVTAGMTAIQIARIRNQPAPEPPSFKFGGLISGSKHGSRYGESGIALIDRKSRREVGEMEGEEWIVPADQVEPNLPFLQELSKRSIAGVKTPLAPGPAFKYGGSFEFPYFEKQMFLFGGKKRKAAKAAEFDMPDLGDLGEIDQESASEAQQIAMEQGMKQLELLESIDEGISELIARTEQVSENTRLTADRTEEVKNAIFSTNTNAKFDILIDKISALSA